MGQTEYKTSEAQRRYMAKQRQNPEYRAKQQQYMKEYRAKNIERFKQKDNEYYKQNARKIVLAKHGLTEVEYQQMLERQGGVCAICKGPPVGRWKMFCVDHDHKTGENRGLLCSKCNQGLDLFHDVATLLRAAAAYLDQFTGPTS